MITWNYTHTRAFVGKPETKVISTSTLYLIHHYPILSNNTFSNPFINHVWNYTYSKEVEEPIVSIGTEDFTPLISPDFYTKLPLFSNTPNVIKIPNKVEYSIRRYIPKKTLKRIHPNIDVATELCLLFLSQLNTTYFEWKDGTNIDGWKSLKAEYLRELVFIESDTYKKVREALETKLWQGPIIECDYYSERWTKCYNYRLTSNYIGKGITNYELKTEEVQSLNLKNIQRRFKEATSNTIAKNLLILYSMIELPTKDEILQKSNQLIKSGYKTKKGKTLTRLNKHPKSYFKDYENRSFVEDNLIAYDYLTYGGLLTPIVGSEISGGRVIDSFSLMPGYIRNMLKINGKPIVECDCSCLHPNIAISLYGGSEGYITHQKVAEETGIDIATIKLEHLSFFNKHHEQMKKSPLYQYYLKKEPKMMKNIINEKYSSNRKHKMTSQKMMEKETKIMTDVIVELSKEGIFVGYVYDALFCMPDHANRVKQVMDEQLRKHEVMTTAKISSPHAS